MKYLNLKKITAVVLSIGMVFSSSAVTGFAADNSKKIATIPSSYINKVAEDIDNKYFYDGTYVDDWGHTRKGRQLGATYTKESTEFLLWAPAATYVKVNIYATGDDNDSNARDIGSYPLEKMLVNGEWNGLWIITLLGDWGGLYYDYTITTTDITHIGSDRTTKYKIQDPYSVAVSKDGKRSYITDTSSVSPEGWDSDRHVYVDSTKANTVYKISVKDFSSDTASGMTAGGKYSAFTEKGAKVNSAGELVSGIDYLKELGVTTVQLAPFADFDGDSEYEILNYNVPEASYASNPSDSKTVIKECKEMIQALHSAGFSVVMEMPYTHASEENPLEKSVPRFYYRLNTDGTRYTTNTGYDNELATERKMYRSYMVNSMKYWAEEYHVDGFSLDLIDCVNVKYKGSSHVYKWLDEIKTSLAKEDANLVIWGDNYTKEERQNKTSSYDEIIGSTGGTYGERNEKAVKIYKQKAAMKYAKPGTLFMDGGEEMCNSVEGRTLADSSYVEWKDSAEYADVVSYYRGLMEIRKAFSPLAKSQTIKNSEAYVLTGTKDGEWNTMAVLNNESDVSKEITIPVQGRAATDWVVIANGESAGVVSLGEVAGSVITVPAYTTMILVDKESFDDVAVTSGKGKVIVNYVIKDSEQKLRESITLQGTSGTNYAVPENIKIPSGYTFLSKTGDEKGVYTSETQTVTYYYNAINPDTVVDGIKNNGVYCEKAQFKVTSSDYTQVMAGNKTLTPDADGIYTLSAADGTQTITLTDNEGYSIYLSVTVNANHTIDNSDCTKESICSVCGKIFLAQANHKFSDTWTKDDTYHWKVCENDGCTVTTTKTKHSGTDDGDCTTPVICECGEIVTAAKSEHIYGEWKSNGNGTHTHKCTTAGCTIESCVGGAATCKKRAVCTDCNAEYGTLNPANHSGNQVWVQTEKTHQKKYDCCGAEVTNIEDHIWDNGHCTVCGYDCIHKGGEATCTQKAVCDTCHSEYGEINVDNHTGTEKWTQTATTHEKKYDCCGKVTIAQENHNWKDGACETCGYVCVHSGGEATCTKGAVCETCGREYTDKDMANHSGKVVWVQTEKTHKQAYDCCDKEVSTSEAHGWKNGVCTVCDYQCKHAGGSATCVKKAVCTICSEEYGTYNMSIHEGLKSVAAKAATRTDEGNIEYWYCKDCDRYYIKQDGLVEIEKSQTVVAKITDTTSSDDTGKGGKTETVKEQTPDTGDNKRVFAWLLMFIIGGAAAGLTIKGKKTEN